MKGVCEKYARNMRGICKEYARILEKDQKPFSQGLERHLMPELWSNSNPEQAERSSCKAFLASEPIAILSYVIGGELFANYRLPMLIRKHGLSMLV